MVASVVKMVLTFPLKYCKCSKKILPVSGFEGTEFVFETLPVLLSVLHFIDIISLGVSCHSFKNLTSFHQGYQDGHRRIFLDRKTNMYY